MSRVAAGTMYSLRRSPLVCALLVATLFPIASGAYGEDTPPCPRGLGLVKDADGRCVCPPGSSRGVHDASRCTRECPFLSGLTCTFHDIALRYGNKDADPKILCGCVPSFANQLLVDVGVFRWEERENLAQCLPYFGVETRERRCACPDGTVNASIFDPRCVIPCPFGRALDCSRHDAEGARGNINASPTELCDCLPLPHLVRIAESGALGLRPAHPLTHCPPVAGEILVNGRCVCPPGTSRASDPAEMRCLPSCDGRWDCTEHEALIATRGPHVPWEGHCECVRR